MTRETRRFRRQIEAVARLAPGVRRVLRSFIDGPLRWVRLPVALLLVAGGLLSFLPVLGLWMLPLGLLLLALDIPALRAPVSAAMIRVRRRLRRLLAEDGALATGLVRLGLRRPRAAPPPPPPSDAAPG